MWISVFYRNWLKVGAIELIPIASAGAIEGGIGTVTVSTSSHWFAPHIAHRFPNKAPFQSSPFVRFIAPVPTAHTLSVSFG